MVQQPVRVFHDEILQKFRLCPFPEGSTANTSSYGIFYFLCGITVSELSTLISTKWKSEPPYEKNFWNYLAEQEERNHKRKYPEYKFRNRFHY
ncbi:hypothetical protein Trco_003642 [Trichoderma cornu-damae]|uniref:HMG box domain-containing protein n=1 Tax=Trichoderma cornu-damae TaxID=654480 RepID=A0A9P8TXH3_9HYPO|nr:hypothetical protein Trco_003642 [Trichoderma cornu-damae]